MDFSQFVEWPVLASYAGATTMTVAIVQFTKGLLDRVIHIPTKFYSYFVALVVLYSGYYFTGQLTPSNAALIFFNGFIIAVASNGMHQSIALTATQLMGADHHD